MSHPPEGAGRVLRSSSRSEQSPEPQVIVAQKDRFSREQDLFSDAKRVILWEAAPTEMVYLDIPTAWGARIADSLTDGPETEGVARQGAVLPVVRSPADDSLDSTSIRSGRP